MSKKTAKKKDSRKITESLPHGSTSSPQAPSTSSGQGTNFKDSILDEIIPSKWVIWGREFQSITLVFLVSTLAFLSVSFLGLLLYYEDEKGRHLASRDNYLYWNEVAQIQKNSPDAYYQAGVYALELGDNQKAYELLGKAVKLDPGFEKALKLQGSIVNER